MDRDEVVIGAVPEGAAGSPLLRVLLLGDSCCLFFLFVNRGCVTHDLVFLTPWCGLLWLLGLLLLRVFVIFLRAGALFWDNMVCSG